MRKSRVLLIGLSMVLLIALATPLMAAGKGEVPAKTTDQLKVVLYMNGNLGDKSFFDSANSGVLQAQKELGISVRSIEGGYDPANWAPDLEQLCQGDWDIIIVGTWQLQEIIQDLAPQYPNKKFFVYDTAVDYSLGGLDNVYSILYKQNEGSYLTGVLAGLITTSSLPYTTPQKKIGFIGGMDIPVINDFMVGFRQGAKSVDPQIETLVAYVGDFNDPAKAKELSLAMFDQGVDIAFNGAAQAGLGLLDAGAIKQRYTIGVDSDQYLLYKDSNPERAKFIVSSMLKNVGASLYRALEMHLAGTLVYGEVENLGIQENGVGLADNENFRAIVPQDFIDRIKEAEQKIQSGEITVETAF
ncbi:MAG: BMP family ABC transporter substrate-binding protein [Sphaerochaetaceae bacterium]|nr:BMP family ABC transporter substrate-binding protein [Sphaerochaetaceae bacterium]MDD3366562.1 BMP family ABC transporter substrate-binding protein [Sphaerochaetaceae bacterium]MDD4220113.1 BMP family ABC transporter substrate-binding protein [Sphaerochaetaceae bacterium]MDY0372294.1 BMP family ABC transporter substrate-binding protein [Sphaerochaetaceae bacterium]